MNVEIRHYKSPDGLTELDVPFINGTAYINATSVYQKFGKPQSSFSTWKTDVLLPYAQRLLELGKFQKTEIPMSGDNQQVTLDDVIITKKGGRAGKDSVEQGTWFHPRLGIVFARWLDLDFEIWCDEQIAELLMTGHVELQPEDQEWIDHATDVYEDCPDGGRRSLANIRKLIIDHVKNGYPMVNFKNMLDDISKYADKDSKEKLFEKIRKLIKNLYEKGTIGRTAHEEMLELATVKVIKILKAEVRKERKLREKFTAKPAMTTALVGPIHTPETATEAKAGHDNAIKEHNYEIDVVSLRLHKAFDLCPITPENPILPCVFGIHRPVADATVLIKEAGYKIAFQDRIIKPPYYEKDKAPDLSTRDRWTKIGVSLWWNEGYNPSIQISKSLGGNEYDKLLTVYLEAKFVEEPGFFYGMNKQKTIMVLFSAQSDTVIIYGVPADKK